MTKIFFACDFTQFEGPQQKQLSSFRRHIQGIKVGLEALTAENSAGRSVASLIRKYTHAAFQLPVCADFKLYGTEDTIARAVENLAEHGYQAITIAEKISYSALKAVGKICIAHGITAFGVTALTDIDTKEYRSRFGETPNQAVLDFAHRLSDYGIQGLVCSVHELEYLQRKGAVNNITTLVAGTRSLGANKNNHKRVSTPADAVRAGADWMVLGRQVLEAPNPLAALLRTKEEMRAAS